MLFTNWKILPKSLSLVVAILFSSGSVSLAQGAHYSRGGELFNYPAFALDLVNKDRANFGSASVQMNAKLNQVAQAYAEYLLRSGFFGHVDPFGRNPQDRARLYGIYAGVSENLAWESSNFENPDVMISRAEQSMMAEPPQQMNHRFNILNPRSRYVGIGIARDGDKVVMVQEFTEQDP